jgi:hypothetical protein
VLLEPLVLSFSAEVALSLIGYEVRLGEGLESVGGYVQ